MGPSKMIIDYETICSRPLYIYIYIWFVKDVLVGRAHLLRAPGLGQCSLRRVSPSTHAQRQSGEEHALELQGDNEKSLQCGNIPREYTTLLIVITIKTL